MNQLQSYNYLAFNSRSVCFKYYWLLLLLSLLLLFEEFRSSWKLAPNAFKCDKDERGKSFIYEPKHIDELLMSLIREKATRRNFSTTQVPQLQQVPLIRLQLECQLKEEEAEAAELQQLMF